MKFKFYTSSESAWEAMLDAMASASESILLEMYAFADNTSGHHFFRIIEQKARSGIRVRIVVDSVGSADLDHRSVAKARAAGVEILFFSYWHQRTHKKILVVDGRVAFIGGVNINKVFRKWLDLQMRLEGPIVKGIIRSFARTYQMCGGTDSEVLAFTGKQGVLGRTKAWVVERWNRGGRSGIRRYYHRGLSGAERSVLIATPYFAPRRWLIGELHQAVLRGAEVRVMVPERTDHWFTDRVNFFYMTRLHRMGLRFHLQREMNHAKAMLVDGREGIVGSQNIDPLSFEYNQEAGVSFTDEKMVRALGRIMEGWMAASVPFDPSSSRPAWYDHLLAPVIRIFLSII